MKIKDFLRNVIAAHKLRASLIAGLFLLAGILELLSLATALPVLMNLLGAEQQAGAAQKLIGSLGFQDLSLIGALTLMSVFMFFRGIIMLLGDIATAHLARGLEADIRGQMFSSLVKSSWKHLISLDLGAVPNMILRETEKYSIAIQKLGQFASSVFIALILILSSVFVSWQAFLIFVVAVTPYLFTSRIFNRAIKKHARKRLEYANEVGARVNESLVQLKFIKAAALEEKSAKRFDFAALKYMEHSYKIAVHTRLVKNFPEVFGVLILSFMLYIFSRVLSQTPTDTLFFLMLLFRGYRQIAGVQTVYSSMLENIPSFAACEQFIKDNARFEEIYTGASPATPSAGDLLTARSVHFSYKDGSMPALNGIDLDIPATGLVALAGRSGSGKTTLADILMGLIAPSSGSIHFDSDSDLFKDINLHDWREIIGYVPQEPHLIAGSLRENILLGATDLSEQNLQRAASMARVDLFADELPQGYETQVGAFGIGLSGGQKQRVAIARALARNPKILILDEATSALDTITESAVQGAITDLTRTMPVLIIAHRLDTIKNADIIYVMEKGQVVEKGRFEDLIRSGSLFRDLYAAAQPL
jgi:ABC-type multidrug transport system fused ATPase/permease subunit